MRTISNRELARQIGVSETAVRRAEKSGRIRREADGAWDLARVKAAWAGNTDRAQQRRELGLVQRSGRPYQGATRPVPEAAVGAVRETLREHGEPVSAGAMTPMQARTANEVKKAQERRVLLAERRCPRAAKRSGSPKHLPAAEDPAGQGAEDGPPWQPPARPGR